MMEGGLFTGSVSRQEEREEENRSKRRHKAPNLSAVSVTRTFETICTPASPALSGGPPHDSPTSSSASSAGRLCRS